MTAIIMIVDDNPADVDLLRVAFAEHDVAAEFIVCGNGIEATRQLEKVQPTLALIDINMPVADGFTVLAAMRSDPRLRDVPAIIFSSSTADRDRERALRGGATRYWVKPSRFHDLVAQVGTLLPLLG